MLKVPVASFTLPYWSIENDELKPLKYVLNYFVTSSTSFFSDSGYNLSNTFTFG